MKTTSKLLGYLLATSCLISCSSMNKNVTENTQSAPNNATIVAGSEADLIQAQSPEQYYEIGRAYQKKAKYYQAVIAYQKSLRLDPAYTKSITGLATVFADQKLYIVSIPLFEQVTKLEPNAINFNNLGYAYYLNQQYVEANRVLTQAITLDPGYVQAQKNLALVANNQPTAELAQDKVETSNQPKAEASAAVANNVVDSSKADIPNVVTQNVDKQITASDSIVVETKPQAKMVQTASSVYELSLDPQLNSVAKAELVISANVKTSQTSASVEKPNNLLAAISGGISFKHAPAINKLFDLASNSIANFNVSDSNKFVEIINGNGIKGIAKAVAGKFKESGNMQLKVADAKRFNQMKTHIQYKSGHRDDAMNLNRNLLNKPYLIRNDNLPNNVALRLVLGRDLIPAANLSAMIEEDADKGLAS